jgi:hypothetical protein
MPDLRAQRLAPRLMTPANHPVQGGASLAGSSRSSSGSASPHAVVLCGGAGAPPCPTTSMLEKLMMGLASVRDPKMVRERFEEDLRSVVRAKSVRFREDLEGNAANPPAGVISCSLPGPAFEGKPRLEAVFDSARPPDARARQMLAAGAHVAALLLEIERANGRWPLACARSRGEADGAAPLIGSSLPIRILRDRIERVAATDFTVLIEGAIGPQPHPSFIDVFGEAAVGDGYREMERKGEH